MPIVLWQQNSEDQSAVSGAEVGTRKDRGVWPAGERRSKTIRNLDVA